MLLRSGSTTIRSQPLLAALAKPGFQRALVVLQPLDQLLLLRKLGLQAFDMEKHGVKAVLPASRAGASRLVEP